MKIILILNFLYCTTVLNVLKNQNRIFLKTFGLLQNHTYCCKNCFSSYEFLKPQNKYKQDKFMSLNQDTKESGCIYAFNTEKMENNKTLNLFSSFFKITSDSIDNSNPKLIKIENPNEMLCNRMINYSFIYNIKNKKLMTVTFEKIVEKLENPTSFLNSEFEKYKITINKTEVISIFNKMIDGLKKAYSDEFDNLNLLNLIINDECKTKSKEEHCKDILVLLNITTEIFNLYLHYYVKREYRPYLFNIYYFKDKI